MAQTITPQSHRERVRVGPTQLLINGEFAPARSGKTFATIDPATEEVIAEIAEGEGADIDRAVGAAREAFDSGPWSQMAARERGRLMLRWADLIEDHLDELARLECLDSGKTLTEALGYDIPSAAAVIRYFGGWADKQQGRTVPIPGDFFTYTRLEPVGVCGLITPWNFPLNLAAWKLGPALAAGCTCVLKPAEQTPLTALRAGELALEAGIPPGVVNVVPGFGPTAGAALVEHPAVDKIAFTGEYKTAQIIKEATTTSMKRLSFELGGKSPNVIFADCDLDEAVTGAYGALFLNQGQNCCAGSRAYVQDEIYDAFVERIAQRADASSVGDPFDPTTDHGALIDRAQLDKAMHYIDVGAEEGAERLAGGHRLFDKGFFVEPTVFAGVTDEMSIAREEIFGPVISLLRFSDVDEVIRRANDTMYGLAAGVWTKDVSKALAIANNVRAGTVWVNCFNIVDAATPFGGYKMSGLGRELGEKALEAYTEHKTVTIATGA